MDTIQILVRQILQMFLLGGLGFCLYRGGKVSAEGSRTLGNILIYLALPATIKLDIPGAEWTSILMGAAAAGISAVKTLIVDYIHAKTKPPEAI